MTKTETVSETRAVVYTRVSTGAQETGTSLAAQFAACSRKAQEIGATIIAHEEETLSGGLYAARPGIQRALELIEAGRANVLIVFRLDRGGRDVDGLRDIRRRVERASAQLVFADGMQFEQNAVGNLMFTQMGAFAEFEREMIRDRTMRGHRALAEAGRVPGRSAAPYGYIIVRKDDVTRGLYSAEQTGHYLKNEAEAHIPPAVFEHFIRLQSLRKTAAHLHEIGFRARNGRAFKPNSLRQILTNRIYYGEAHWGKKRRILDESRAESGRGIYTVVDAPESAHIIIPAPAYVSRATWDAANTLLASGRAQRSGPPTDYLLTGLVFCPDCGRRCYAQKRRNTRQTKDYDYKLFCAANYPVMPGHAPGCRKRSFGGLALERFVFDALKYLLQNPQVIEKSIELAHSENARRQKKAARTDDAATVARLKTEIVRLQQREIAAAGAALDARMAGQSPETYEQLRVASATARADLENRLQVLAAPIIGARPALPAIEGTPQVLAVLTNPDASRAVKRAIIESLVASIYPIPPEAATIVRSQHNTAGAALILQSEGESCFVLRCTIGKYGAYGSISQTKTTLQVLAASPYPSPIARPRSQTTWPEIG